MSDLKKAMEIIEAMPSSEVGHKYHSLDSTLAAIKNPDGNFLAETVDAMKRNQLEPLDIVFIGSIESGHACDWEQFVNLANFNYDSGYGLEEVVVDLVIIFGNGARMSRGNYDGSEWWEVLPAFVTPQNFSPIVTLRGRGDSLSDVNESTVEVFATEMGQPQLKSAKQNPHIDDADFTNNESANK